jgi:hypothetical protein
LEICVTRRRLFTVGLCVIAFTWQRPCGAQWDVAGRKIELLAPGSIVGDGAPKPWTHLIVKSQPRVTAGDVNKVSNTQLRLAGMFFMATLAQVDRVERGGQAYFRLARLASGIGTNISGRDTIVSPDTTSRLGANVGFLGGILLGEMHDKQRTVEVVLRSETTAVYDTPIVIRLDDKNRTLVLRYGILVDPPSGRLESLCWLIDVDDQQRYLRLVGNMQWLAADKVMDCQLYVDKSQYTLGVPSDNAFACLKIPQGRVQFAINDPQLARLLIKKRWSREEAPAVDAALRDILRRGGASEQKTSAR